MCFKVDTFYKATRDLSLYDPDTRNYFPVIKGAVVLITKVEEPLRGSSNHLIDLIWDCKQFRFMYWGASNAYMLEEII